MSDRCHTHRRPSWPPHRRPLYRECGTCLSPMGPMWILGDRISFGWCLNPACFTHIPLTAVFVGGGQHMTQPSPCGNDWCVCDGRPWWWPGKRMSEHLD